MLLLSQIAGLQNVLEKVLPQMGHEHTCKKTKVMIFQNVSKIKNGHKFSSNKVPIVIVRGYTYMGINFVVPGSLKNAYKMVVQKSEKKQCSLCPAQYTIT